MQLDGDQLSVATAPSDRRQIVVAGPGSGKTTTAVELTHNVLDTADDDQVVLFVSFSNAALAATDRAFDDLPEDHHSRVVATTLDSLAGQLIEHQYQEQSRVDFDDVLRSAVSKLEESYTGELDDVAHLVVDEGQDLSASRRALLLAVIDVLPEGAGFTVFGDPLQAIYRFLDPSEESQWQALTDGLHAAGVVHEAALTGEYRSRTARTRRVSTALRSLRTDQADSRTILRTLDEAMIEVPSTSLDRIGAQILKWAGSTAVLTRTNVEALEITDHLLRAGVPVAFTESRSTGVVLDRWLSDLYAHCGGAPLTRESFERAAAEIPSLQSAWFQELTLATDSFGTMPWLTIRDAVYRRDSAPRPWHQGADGRVVVSTVHQAKGREFDNVVIVEPSMLVEKSEPTPDSGFETLYVALTRARDRVFGLAWPAQYTRRATDTCRTAYRTHPGTKGLTAIEITPNDLRLDRDFADRAGQPSFDDLPPGQCIEFELLNSVDRPVYRCRLNGRTAGVTTDEFGDRLKSLSRRPSWPDLGPVPIESVATASGGMGADTKFWSVVRPRGFSEVTYRKQR